MSLLGKAKPLVEPLKAVKGKKAKVEVEIQGLEELAVANALRDAVEGYIETLDGIVKNQGRDKFLESDGIRKPDNFTGTEGIATASIQLRKRTTRSTLTDEEAHLLESNGIPYEVVEDKPELIAFDPEQLKDPAQVKKIEKALEKAGLTDVLVKQERVSRKVVSDESVAKVFEKGLAHELIDIVTTLAIRATLHAPAEKQSLELVKKILGKH